MSRVPNKLRKKKIVKLTDFAGNLNVVPDVTRQLTLNEVHTDDGPLMAILNNSRFEDMPEMGMFGAPTETPVEGQTEVWQIVNLTIDGHPIHLHLIQFQIVSRQDFDVDAYSEPVRGFIYRCKWRNVRYVCGRRRTSKFVRCSEFRWCCWWQSCCFTIPYGNTLSSQDNENGWKDVVVVYPGQVTNIVARWAPTSAKT